ncbi:DnaB-like helicase N-terminal domain-containing protein [Acinetobacter soli]|uniref:DnaB-like helicase N-terminal domain-containing protein n=1 Tax=Acinetobacter soli TaxID=487316 RepID=UPI001D186454|nr:DnaB-like helicase N-terminal domain-containing protein [Acinetobacter soli]
MIELYSIPLEQTALSTIMGSDQGADEFVSVLDQSDFFSTKHQIIFGHIKAQHAKGESFDEVTVYELIKANTLEHNQIDEKFITNLMSAIKQPYTLETHIKKLKDFASRRLLWSWTTPRK